MHLYGKNSVIERLRHNPSSIKKIQIEFGFAQAADIYKKAKKWGIPVIPVPKSKIDKLGRNLNTQGIIVDIEDFQYTDYPNLLEQAYQKKHSLLFLDNLNDPHNLGGIIRSLACLGNFAVVLPTHDSVSVTESVLRVASGGDNYVPVARVSNLNNAIRSAKEMGFTIAGGVIQGGQSIIDTPLPFPLGLVIGSEQKGIRDVVRKNLDLELTIPMQHDTLSLNATHAVTIFCYEITKQKILHKK